jgi:hypothetical protein
LVSLCAGSVVFFVSFLVVLVSGLSFPGSLDYIQLSNLYNSSNFKFLNYLKFIIGSRLGMGRRKGRDGVGGLCMMVFGKDNEIGNWFINWYNNGIGCSCILIMAF